LSELRSLGWRSFLEKDGTEREEREREKRERERERKRERERRFVGQAEEEYER